MCRIRSRSWRNTADTQGRSRLARTSRYVFIAMLNYARNCTDTSKQMVNRALSFAMSDPKGPVYLYGAREPMEEDIEPYKLNQAFWAPVEPTALPQSGVAAIAEALTHAQEPLVVVG